MYFQSLQIIDNPSLEPYSVPTAALNTKQFRTVQWPSATNFDKTLTYIKQTWHNVGEDTKWAGLKAFFEILKNINHSQPTYTEIMISQ